jgi:hypothetical protein
MPLVNLVLALCIGGWGAVLLVLVVIGLGTFLSRLAAGDLWAWATALGLLLLWFDSEEKK